MSGRRTVAAVALLREDGAALLQHRDDKPGLPAANLWVFPGGHLEAGESNEAGARREFLEETEYQCDRIEWLCSLDDIYSPGASSYDLHVYFARYDGRQACVCREGQALEFIAREQVEKIDMPPYQRLIWDLALLRLNATQEPSQA